MSRITNKELMAMLNSINDTLKGIDERVTALEESGKTTTKKTSKKSSPKSTKKTKSSGDFDRALYESTAKRLGVYNTEYGKVTATVKNGKVISTARQNRDKVYKAMGIK